MNQLHRYTHNLIGIRIILCLPLVAFAILLCNRPLYAQGLSLSIYPPVIEIETTPPSSPLAPIVIQNNSNESIRLEIELIPIKQNGATGEVTLDPSLIGKEFYAYYRDKIQFLVDDKKTNSLTLDALETKEVLLNVNLEKGDPPGDYYYSIVFLSPGSQPEESSLSRIPAGIATNLLLSVGPRKEAQGGISEFKTSFFKNSGPVYFSLKLHNASGHLIQPQGNVLIENMFGKKVGNIPILPQYILSNSDRYLINESFASESANLSYNNDEKIPKIAWKESFLLGVYKASAEVQLEENGRTINSVVYFIAFPIYLLVGLVVFIFVMLSIYLRVRKKI